MVASEARILADRQNCLKSTGPSEAGKLHSRRNGLKHGLTASVVLPEGDGDEIERRTSALAADLDPKSPLGAILIRQMATLSVKMERGAKQESEALAARVRHAADAFDEARIDEAKRLFAGLADDPREAVRKLRKSPEGVDRLVMAWRDLRSGLTARYYPGWLDAEFDLAARLLGLTLEPRNSPFGKLSRACLGQTTGLEAEPGSELAPAARKAWARDRLYEIIDAEIDALIAHRATLDFETIALDRAGAADIALFDASPDATSRRLAGGSSRRWRNSRRSRRKSRKWKRLSATNRPRNPSSRPPRWLRFEDARRHPIGSRPRPGRRRRSPTSTA
jgi:hypothetical protein